MINPGREMERGVWEYLNDVSTNFYVLSVYFNDTCSITRHLIGGKFEFTATGGGEGEGGSHVLRAHNA